MEFQRQREKTFLIEVLIMNKNPNTEGITKYSKKKTEEAVMKVEKVIKDLIQGQQMINFNIVCTKSGVSKSFLYKNLELRDRIERLRKQQIGLQSSKHLKRQTSDSSKDVIIAVLQSKNEQLKKENKELKFQLQKYLNKIYDEI